MPAGEVIANIDAGTGTLISDVQDRPCGPAHLAHLRESTSTTIVFTARPSRTTSKTRPAWPSPTSSNSSDCTQRHQRHQRHQPDLPTRNPQRPSGNPGPPRPKDKTGHERNDLIQALIALVILVVMVLRWRTQHRRLLATGLRTPGQVMKVSPTSWRFRKRRQYVMQVVTCPQGDVTISCEHRSLNPRAVGTALTVANDPAKPSVARVVEDHE